VHLVGFRKKKTVRVGDFFVRAERRVDSREDLYSLEYVAVITLRGKKGKVYPRTSHEGSKGE
jgi:hypothetical protein